MKITTEQNTCAIIDSAGTISIDYHTNLPPNNVIDQSPPRTTISQPCLHLRASLITRVSMGGNGNLLPLGCSTRVERSFAMSDKASRQNIVGFLLLSVLMAYPMRHQIFFV